MKNIKNLLHQPTLRCLIIGLAAFTLASFPAKANPFASCVTNDSGTIRFYMNETGAVVTVTFEDNSTINMGYLNVGRTNFALGGHTGYKITATKIANGTPFLITSDTNPTLYPNYTNCNWANPRGIACYNDPPKGNLFGRVFICGSGPGGYTTTATIQYFKGQGVYAYNADLSDALGTGTNAAFTSTFSPAGAGGLAPWKMQVGQDKNLWICDSSPGFSCLYFAPPDLTSITRVFAFVGDGGVTSPNREHGQIYGAYATGSLATGDLKVFTADRSLGAPGPPCQLGDVTSIGDYNCLFRYDIGGGPLPWSQPPDYANNLGLTGFQNSQVPDVGWDPHYGYLWGCFRRDNLSDGCIQTFNQNAGGFNRLYTSLHDGADVMTTRAAGGANNGGGAYAGVVISPDGRYMATMTIQNEIKIANIASSQVSNGSEISPAGCPDESTLISILNLPSTTIGRGIAWDAADNIWMSSSGSLLVRCYSLGISSTTVYSNDWSGTNGTFTLTLPEVTATVATTTPLASQNYVNNTVGAGTPIPGVFTINLNKSTLAEPVVVAYTLGGTAGYNTTNKTDGWPVGTYTVWGITNNVNLYTNADGVIFTTNTVTFPAGTKPGGGNWSAALNIIPTKTPYFGPSYSVTIRLGGGPNYIAGAPLSGTISIQNTGPNVLFLSAAAAAAGPTMNRGIPNDYARFIVTRWGDTNGPGNSAGSVAAKDYSHNNFFYSGTAVYPTDYTARAQRLDSFATSTLVPADGAPGITVKAGEVTIDCVVGNPVKHTNVSVPPINVTVIINQTNGAQPVVTNYTSPEGWAYSVTTNNPVTLTEVDNAVGFGGVVLWSDALTNAAGCTNWTLTFASTNLAGVTTNPVVIPIYSNAPIAGDLCPPGGNDYDVQFGWPIVNDGVPPSDTMLQNGWDTVLRMTCNKSGGYAPAGVNVFPRGMNFAGNFALRFDMYLSLQANAINNPNAGTYPREFAAFGINHYGTNCMWRLATGTVPAGQPGSGMTNFDGMWFAIGADTGSQTPADWDGFISPPLPNSGVPSDFVSNPNTANTGIFKRPPFVGRTAGGQPDNKWVNVSLEVNRQTNCTLYVDQAPVLANFFTTNRGFNVGSVFYPTYTNGTVMLGYLDPVKDVSDQTAFAYFSNVRVVELSPYLLIQAANGLPTAAAGPGMIVTQFTTIRLTNAANLAQNPVTNIWYQATTNAVPTMTPILTNTANATNIISILTNTILNGTNFYGVCSDAAGSVTSSIVIVEVILGPTNQVANAGSTIMWPIRATGNMGPIATNIWWKTNGVNLATNAHYNGGNSTNLWITNVVAADAGIYSVGVTNNHGSVNATGTLTVISAVAPASQTNLVGTTASFSVTATGPTPTYRWQRNGVDLSDGGNISGATTPTLTIANLATNDAGSYTVRATTGAGVISSAGLLSVILPKFSNVSLVGTDVVLSFYSPNSLIDTTNAFTLQSSPVVTGPYVNTPGNYTISGGTVQITVPQTGTNMFYRLLHVY